MIDKGLLKRDELINLVTYYYPAKTQPPIGVILFYHGLYSYSQRYAHVAKKFSAAGYDVLSFD
jgi:alpha-beta hydrolase superfamily lysophospholipase